MQRIQPSDTVETHPALDGAVEIPSSRLEVDIGSFHILDAGHHRLKSGTHSYCSIHTKRRDAHAEELGGHEDVTARLDQRGLDAVLGQVQIRTLASRLRRRWDALDFGGLPVANASPVRD